MNVQNNSSQAELAECARRLDSLVRRASTFVAQQLGLLDDIGLQMAAETRQSMSAESVARLDQSEWMQQKTADEVRIADQLDHLANAWKELESEQRRLMMLERETQQPTFAPATALPSSSQNAPPAVQETREPQPAVPPRSRDLIDATAPQDAAAAALQFQKLKREIRQQTRQQR